MILLDTHALLWAVAEPRQLSRPALAAIHKARREDGLAIAAVTLWELAVLVARGRIQAYGTVDASLRLLVEALPSGRSRRELRRWPRNSRTITRATPPTD